MPGLQYWFSGTAFAAFLALLAGIAGVAGLSYGWYLAAVKEMTSATSAATTEEQRDKIRQIKSLIGKAMQSGKDLLQKIPTMEASGAERAANEWGQPIHDLIAAAYGEGEATLFLDSTGYTFFSGSAPNTNVRLWIEGRLRRLSELLPRADTLPVRRDFDPAMFK